MINRQISLFLFFLIYLGCSFTIKGQESSDSINYSTINKIDYEIAFSNHLIQLKDYDNAIENLKLLISDTIEKDLLDSIYFLIARSMFYLKNFDSSIVYFNYVSQNASFFKPAVLYTSLSYSYLADYDNAEKAISKIKETDTNLLQMLYLNQSGISLLKRDIKKGNENIQKFTKTWYPVAEQQEKMNLLYNDIATFKNKSPIIAGVLSSVIPGLGKVYANRLGEGVSAFLITTTMGLVAFENYRKDGWKDPKTILFSSLFSVFYIGNIWGSVLSVKLVKDEFNQEINEQILFNLRVPLRIIFE